MLFSRRPKFRKDDFFNREEELRLLVRGIEVGEGLIVVYGVRRIGKTSLVWVGLGEADVPFVPVDLRRFSEEPALLSPKAIAEVVSEVLKKYERLRQVKEIIEKILHYVESLDLKAVKLRVKSGGKELFSKTLRWVDEWAGRRGTKVAIILDEAQELRTIPAWRSLLAWAIDELENVTFVVTGSEVGVLKDFLKLDDPSSPLFGRPRLEIKLEKFTRDESSEFLKRGFEEAGMNVKEEEIVDVVNKLDCIVGWLTLYGYYRVSYGFSHNQALSALEREAVELVGSELEKLVKYSPKRYLAILWALALGLKKWSTIKHFAEGVAGYMPDNKFDRLLRNLVEYGFVKKDENLEYEIIDPLLPKAIEVLRKKYNV